MIIINREQAIQLLGCKNNTKPYNIKKCLENRGYKDINIKGRSDRTVFECRLSSDDFEKSYYEFKNKCIKEYGYGSNFDYDKMLEIIDFHINNKEYITIEEMSRRMNVNEKTMYRHRRKLSNTILKDTKDCDVLNEKPKELNVDNKFYIYMMHDINDQIIYVGKTINIKDRMRSHFYKKEEDWHNEVSYVTYSDVATNSDMTVYEIYYINKYKPKYNITHLYDDSCTFKLPKLEFKRMEIAGYSNNCNYNYEYRLYEITEDLKHDKDLLEVITKAIEHSKLMIKK